MTDGEVRFDELTEWLDLPPHKIDALSYPHRIAAPPAALYTTTPAAAIFTTALPAFNAGHGGATPALSEREQILIEREKLHDLAMRETAMELKDYELKVNKQNIEYACMQLTELQESTIKARAAIRATDAANREAANKTKAAPKTKGVVVKTKAAPVAARTKAAPKRARVMSSDDSSVEFVGYSRTKAAATKRARDFSDDSSVEEDVKRGSYSTTKAFTKRARVVSSDEGESTATKDLKADDVHQKAAT